MFTVRLRAPDTEATLGYLLEATSLMAQAREDIAQQTADEMKAAAGDSVRSLGAVYKGKLVAGLTATAKPTRSGAVIGIMQPRGTHARVVQAGREAGTWPRMSAKFRTWVRYRTGASGKELDRVAFVIARAIKRRGIPARDYLGPAQRAGEVAVGPIAESVLTDVAGKLR